MQGAEVVDRGNETIEIRSLESAICSGSLLILRAELMWLILRICKVFHVTSVQS